MMLAKAPNGMKMSLLRSKTRTQRFILKSVTKTLAQTILLVKERALWRNFAQKVVSMVTLILSTKTVYLVLSISLLLSSTKTKQPVQERVKRSKSENS